MGGMGEVEELGWHLRVTLCSWLSFDIGETPKSLLRSHLPYTPLNSLSLNEMMMIMISRYINVPVARLLQKSKPLYVNLIHRERERERERESGQR
jgi:hypothetical protein